MIFRYQIHCKIEHAGHRSIWWMNFEQDAKQYCARPDKNNNMNLTMDIGRKCYFPSIWWKQPVSINEIGILKTASTVLGYMTKKLIFTVTVGKSITTLLKIDYFEYTFLKVWQHFPNHLMISLKFQKEILYITLLNSCSWSKQNLTLSKNKLAITDMKTNVIIYLIKPGISICLERNLNPLSFTMHLRKYRHPPPPPLQPHTKTSKKPESKIC